MRGQKNKKQIKRTGLVQRSLPLMNVFTSAGEKPKLAFQVALQATRKYTLAGDFDGCVKLALEREKNL